MAKELVYAGTEETCTELDGLPELGAGWSGFQVLKFR